MSYYPIERDITTTLSLFADSLSYSDLPVKTRENLCLYFLDYIASTHAGYRINQSMNKVVESVIFDDATDGDSHVMFSSCCTSPLNASFINAFYAHGADMDDGNKGAAGHIGAHVVSSLMALAEVRKSRFYDFFTAMAVGYDVFCRLSSACMPHLVDRGFHSTGTVGALASAAACAKLLGLDSEGIANAISLSATQASGLLLAGETRQDMKPLNPANASRTGVLSALLVERGAKGPLRPLESNKGWCHAMTPSVDFDRLFDGLGSSFSIDQCYLKLYPSCRHTHCAIEAALEIGEVVNPIEIEHIEIVTYGHAIDLAGKIDVPSTIGEAKFSIKYAVAVALSRGHFELNDLDSKKLNKIELSLIEKMRLVLNDELERPFEGIRGARLTVKTLGGRIFKREILIPKGDPENPFTIQDIKNKFRSCYCDSIGNPDPKGSSVFLDWYYPILEDPNNRFVFPDRRVVK